MGKFLVQHGALLIFNSIQLITLIMICLNKAWNVLPAFGFVLLINGIYGVGYVSLVKKKERDKLQAHAAMPYCKEELILERETVPSYKKSLKLHKKRKIFKNISQ